MIQNGPPTADTPIPPGVSFLLHIKLPFYKVLGSQAQPDICKKVTHYISSIMPYPFIFKVKNDRNNT